MYYREPRSPNSHDLELIRRADCRTLELNHGEIVFDSAERIAAPGASAP